MEYMPSGVPGPEPSFDDREYWERCQQKRLAFQACSACGKCRHPPGPYCPHCSSDQITWVEAPTVGELFSYTVIYHPAHESVRSRVPYNVVIVAFPDLGVRVISNVVNAAPDELQFGMPLKLVWGQASNGQAIPLFEKM